MGLDMYAYSIRESLLSDSDVLDVPLRDITYERVGFTNTLPKDYTEEVLKTFIKARKDADELIVQEGIADFHFAYWRKFNHLHGWMDGEPLSQ